MSDKDKPVHPEVIPPLVEKPAVPGVIPPIVLPPKVDNTLPPVVTKPPKPTPVSPAHQELLDKKAELVGKIEETVKRHGGQTSNIPINHEFWGCRNELQKVTEELKLFPSTN